MDQITLEELQRFGKQNMQRTQCSRKIGPKFKVFCLKAKCNMKQETKNEKTFLYHKAQRWQHCSV